MTGFLKMPRFKMRLMDVPELFRTEGVGWCDDPTMIVRLVDRCRDFHRSTVGFATARVREKAKETIVVSRPVQELLAATWCVAYLLEVFPFPQIWTIKSHYLPTVVRSNEYKEHKEYTAALKCTDGHNKDNMVHSWDSTVMEDGVRMQSLP